MGTKTEVREENVSEGWKWVTHKNKFKRDHFFFVFLSSYVFKFCYKAEGLKKSFWGFLVFFFIYL